MVRSGVHWWTFDHEEIFRFCLLQPELFDVSSLHCKILLFQRFGVFFPLVVLLELTHLLLLGSHPGLVQPLYPFLQTLTSGLALVLSHFVVLQLVLELPLLVFNLLNLLLELVFFKLLYLLLKHPFPGHQHVLFFGIH